MMFLRFLVGLFNVCHTICLPCTENIDLDKTTSLSTLTMWQDTLLQEDTIVVIVHFFYF